MYVVIEGKIQGKGRPRFYGHHAVTPEATVVYENKIMYAYKKDGGVLNEGPLMLDIWANFKIPESYSKKRRQECELGHEMPTKKPDIDNIAKAVLDGLNGVAYKDDSQVTHLKVRKRYTTQAEHLIIQIQADKGETDGDSSAS